MSNKILVAYASRGGSTAGVADAIGKTLAASGVEVEVRPMREVYDLTPYRAVVAGSAIHREKWLPEAMQFMNRHQKELAQKPFAAFLVCMALAMKNGQRREKTKKTAADWLQPVRALVNPVSEGLFAGVLDLSKMPSIFFWIVARLIILFGLWSEGDYRDWDAIRHWANNLPETLVGKSREGGIIEK
jgi:menaquinone-dependent protoporphyrinogen oxidase